MVLSELTLFTGDLRQYDASIFEAQVRQGQGQQSICRGDEADRERQGCSGCLQVQAAGLRREEDIINFALHSFDIAHLWNWNVKAN